MKRGNGRKGRKAGRDEGWKDGTKGEKEGNEGKEKDMQGTCHKKDVRM